MTPDGGELRCSDHARERVADGGGRGSRRGRCGESARSEWRQRRDSPPSSASLSSSRGAPRLPPTWTGNSPGLASVDGAEAELRSSITEACGTFSGLDNVVPWSMILPAGPTPGDSESRNRNARSSRRRPNIGAMQDPIIQAIFAASHGRVPRDEVHVAPRLVSILQYVLTPTGAALTARDGGRGGRRLADVDAHAAAASHLARTRCRSSRWPRCVASRRRFGRTFRAVSPTRSTRRSSTAARRPSSRREFSTP